MLSVIIPVYDGAATLEELLVALRAQKLDRELEIVVPLTPSKDASRAIALNFGARVIDILPGEFEHGETRNLAALAARGEHLVFLSQDTLPADDQFLRRLVEPLRDERVFGVTGRMLPRPGASVATLRSLREEASSQAHPRRVAIEDFEAYRSMPAGERRAMFFYNNVCGAIPKRIWRRLPFPRARFGEDLKWARRALEAGGALVYEPSACVIHSHEPGWGEAYSRAWEDARLLAEELGRPPLRTLAEALRWAWRETRADAHYRRIYERRAPRGTLFRRYAEAVGAWRGALAHTHSAPVSDELPLRSAPERMRILHVVHGFPPESRAGTELACLALAQAQRDAGHDVAVFARSEQTQRTEFDTWREDYAGLAVWRVAHHLRHEGGIVDTYRLAPIEREFQKVLAQFQPDIVHFQHLLHLSTTMVPIAARSGAATVATLHDYWPICPRVQLLRPNGKRCAGPQRLGCYLCVKNRWLPLIGVMRRVSTIFERFAARWVACLPHRSRDRMAKDLRALLRRTRAMRRTYASLDWMLAPSRYLKRVIGDARGWQKDKIRVVENGLLNPERFRGVRQAVRAPGPLRVGFLGSLVPHKGIAMLLHAVRGLPLELHVHGRFDPAREPFHAELRDLALAARAQFHGGYDSAALPQLLADLDCVVLPSLWAENSPVVLQECAAAGTPVLVPRMGGFEEKVRSGVDGWFFRPSSRTSLRRALEARLEELQQGTLLRGEPREVRSAAEQAQWIDVGYRSAWLQRRSQNATRVLFERWGRDIDEVLGDHEIQGRDYLLLRPAHVGACVYAWEYARDLREDIERGEPAELELEMMYFGGESAVPIGASVFFNNQLCGEVRSEAAGARDQLKCFRFKIALNGGQNHLRIENAVRGQRVYTRIRRVRVIQRAIP